VHELPVVGQGLEIALKHAEQHRAGRIIRVHLTIGALTDLVDEWVLSYFSFLAKDTIARDAELVIERIPITVLCGRSDKPFTADKKTLDFICPDCGEKGTQLLRGRGFTVMSIEIQ
jgi:hydrogenase nickel incorporation protein HypA/HybF